MRTLLFPHKIEYKEFSFNGMRIILDVLTSMPFQINKITSDILKHGLVYNKETLTKVLLSKYTQQQINSAIYKIQSLRNKGFLLAKNEDGANIFKPQPHESLMSLGWVYLNVVHGCNLRCRYCYGGHGDFGSGHIIMSKKIAHDSIDFMLRHIGPHKHLAIRFFGGEPLLAFPLIRDVVFYAKDKAKRQGVKVHFYITTNATLIKPEIADFLSSHFGAIDISIDGSADMHNLHRPFVTGMPSYDKVKKGIDLLLARCPRKIAAAITITQNCKNISDIEEIYNNIKKLGIRFCRTNFCLYSPQGLVNFNRKSLVDFIKRYSEFTLSQPASLILHRIKKCIRIMKESSPDGLGCSLGRASITIDPKGKIFPCNLFQGIDKFRIGNIYNGFDKKRHNWYTDRLVDNLNKCSGCWARYLCGGGCPSVNFQMNKKIDEPAKIYCYLSKTFIKLAIYIIMKNNYRIERKTKLSVADDLFLEEVTS